MRSGCILFLLVFCVPAHLPGLETGVGLQAMITKAENASSLAVGPTVSLDLRLKGIEMSMEVYSVAFIGSTVGMNLKLWYSLPLRVWRPRIGVGTGFAVNDRIVYGSSLKDLSSTPPLTWDVVVSLEPLRFMFREGGVSFLVLGVFTNLNGPGHEIGATVTLFRFIGGKNDDGR